MDFATKSAKRVTEKVKGGCCPFSIAHRVLKYVGLLQGGEGEGEGGGGIESRDGACMVSDLGALYIMSYVASALRGRRLPSRQLEREVGEFGDPYLLAFGRSAAPPSTYAEMGENPSGGCQVRAPLVALAAPTTHSTRLRVAACTQSLLGG